MRSAMVFVTALTLAVPAFDPAPALAEAGQGATVQSGKVKVPDGELYYEMQGAVLRHFRDAADRGTFRSHRSVTSYVAGRVKKVGCWTVGREPPSAGCRSSLEQAQAALQAAARRIFGTEPNARSPRVILRPAGLGQMGTVSALERPLLILSAAGGLVLLVVCTNVAGLLLVGGSRRRREMATRLAQGAPRVRLVRQLLVETLVLALGGGAAGLLLVRATASILAAWGTDVAGTQGMSGGTRLAIGLSLDGRWLACALLLSIAAALASGLVPALTASRVNIVEAFKGVEVGPRGARSGLGFKRLLVVAQAAASVVLVSVSGLLLRSFLNVSAVPLGFRTEGLVTATIQGPPGAIDGPGGEALLDDLIARSSRRWRTLLARPGSGVRSGSRRTTSIRPVPASIAQRRNRKGTRR